MAKVKMMCPFSKEACIDCAIYRGRHFYLCFSKEYHGVSLGEQQIEELKAQYVKVKDREDNKFEIPETIRVGSKCMQNIEDIVQMEEFKEKGK
ncbi:MAG TPA: hypothetical protein DDW17_01595 [Deltaproteobacteria bacterium]|nr:hypothetical protein [Deltaproteobacteria bacterium]